MRRVGKSVITLALAAEEQLPETELPHVWSIVKEKKPAASRLFNETRNWLKHNDDDEKKDEHYISEFEAHVSLVRDVSKYHAAYGEETDEMGSFVEFSRARGFTLSSPD